MQSFKAQAQRGSEIQLPQGLTTNTHTHTDEQGPVLGKMSPSPKGLGTQKPKTNKKIVFLQVLGSIDPGIYRPWDLSALGSIDPSDLSTLDLSTFGSIDPRIYRADPPGQSGGVPFAGLGPRGDSQPVVFRFQLHCSGGWVCACLCEFCLSVCQSI